MTAAGEEIPHGKRRGPRARPQRDPSGTWLDADPAFELRPGEDLELHADRTTLASARRFRDVLGRFASGVTVVTGLSDDEPVGLTCQSFCSVSLEPPLVLFVPARTSRSWPLIHRSGAFCVNVLAADRADVSAVMATRGADKFAEVKWTPAPVTGSPALEGSLAQVDCRIEAVHAAGDHDVVIGRVVDLITPEEAPGAAEREPLLFYRSAYRTVADR